MKGKTIIIFIIIIVLLSGLFYFSDILFSITGDTESQLREEYITYWADGTDETVQYLSCQIVNSQEELIQLRDTHERPFCVDYRATPGGWYYYFGEKFYQVYKRGSSGISTSGDLIDTWADDGEITVYPNSFKGQEVVILLSQAYNGGYVKINGITNEGANEFTYQSGKEALIKLIPHTFDMSVYDIIINGVKVNEVKTDGELSFYFYAHSTAGGSNAGVLVDFIGYKTQYSCDLSEDEVWIQENFAEPFSIYDLEFVPTKFCKETRPFVLRDIQQGETPIYPDPIPAFNRGEAIIPNGKIVTVNYATYYVEGVNNKCEPNEANIKVANKWVCTQVIKPIEIVVQCQDNTDCPQPLKNECPDYFVGCIDNFCTYDDTILNSEVCKNEVVTIVKQYEIAKEQIYIDVNTDNVFTFTQSKDKGSFVFGDVVFTAEVPMFLCAGEYADNINAPSYINPPNPRDECWTTKFDWKGAKIPIQNKETKQINNFISTTYLASGSYILDPDIDNDGSTGFNNDDWYNMFIFNVVNGLGIDLDPDNIYVKQDTTKEINFDVYNNLPSNDDAFVKITQTVRATNKISTKEFAIKLEHGENTVSIPIETENLGINRIEMQVFYKISADSDVLIKSDKFITNYNIVSDLPSTTEYTSIQIEEVQTGQISTPFKFNYGWLIAGITLIVILLIIIVVIKKK